MLNIREQAGRRKQELHPEQEDGHLERWGWPSPNLGTPT